MARLKRDLNDVLNGAGLRLPRACVGRASAAVCRGRGWVGLIGAERGHLRADAELDEFRGGHGWSQMCEGYLAGASRHTGERALDGSSSIDA